MSTIILSVMLLIYCQIIYVIFYLHYFGYVGGVGCKVYHVTLWFLLYNLWQAKHSKLQNLSLDTLGTVLCKNRLKYWNITIWLYGSHMPSTILFVLVWSPWHHTSLFKYSLVHVLC